VLANAFVNSKKMMDMKLLADQSGIRALKQLDEKDAFQMQHHHLLTCLEKTTVISFAYSSFG
jgi:potassium voltage-gated channel Shal-related subfamily D protein 2